MYEFKEIDEQLAELERFIDNSDVDKARRLVNDLEAAEIAQPVVKPSAADSIIKEAIEWKN